MSIIIKELWTFPEKLFFSFDFYCLMGQLSQEFKLGINHIFENRFHQALQWVSKKPDLRNKSPNNCYHFPSTSSNSSWSWDFVNIVLELLAYFNIVLPQEPDFTRICHQQQKPHLGCTLTTHRPSVQLPLLP